MSLALENLGNVCNFTLVLVVCYQDNKQVDLHVLVQITIIARDNSLASFLLKAVEYGPF